MRFIEDLKCNTSVVNDMTRIDLFVPYSEKDEAKAFGAKWDNVLKLWYIPEGVDPSAFDKWRTNPATIPNVRCNRFYVATAEQNCESCSAPVQMVTFVLPRGWELWETDDEDGLNYWEMYECDVILTGIRWINEAALKAVQKYSSNFRFVHKGYLNHCGKCGSAQEEPNSGNIHVFKPHDAEQAKQITLQYFCEPFECNCRHQGPLYCHFGYNAFDLMQQDFDE